MCARAQRLLHRIYLRTISTGEELMYIDLGRSIMIPCGTLFESRLFKIISRYRTGEGCRCAMPDRIGPYHVWAVFRPHCYVTLREHTGHSIPLNETGRHIDCRSDCCGFHTGVSSSCCSPDSLRALLTSGLSDGTQAATIPILTWRLPPEIESVKFACSIKNQ